MPQPTQTDVHVDRPLTNISTAYIQSATAFVSGQVFREVPVENQTDKYYTWTKADWFRDEAKVRADTTESAGSGYGLSTDSYSCDVYAFHKDIGDQVRANADAGIDLESGATRFVTQRLLVRQENQWVSDYFGTGKWGTDVTGNSNFTYWSDYTASDPITNIEDGKRTILVNTGFMPNTLVMGYDVWIKLRHHPQILNRISGGATSGNPAMVTQELVAQVVGVERILVAQAVQNTAVEGETAVYAFTHGKHALLCYANPNPGLLEPSAGYRFVWRGVSDGMGANIGITRFRMQNLRADRVEAQIAWDNKLVATDLGYFFASAVA